jgi:hypothetical protein
MARQSMARCEGQSSPHIRRRQRLGKFTVVVAALAILAGATPAAAEDYDSKRAGHPLRILAYVVHPVGVILDWLIFRPAHWIGSHEPIKTLVGQEK